MPETLPEPVSDTAQVDLLALCGWHGTITTFLALDEKAWLRALDRHHRAILNRSAEAAQTSAWRETYHLLQLHLRQLVQDTLQAASWTLVFEYELSMDFRRTDLIILAGPSIVLLEFKGTDTAEPAHFDQLKGYARDLQYYHHPSYGHPLHRLLVLTRWSGASRRQGTIFVIGPHKLAAALAYLGTQNTGVPIDPEHWLNTWGASLPHLIDAARAIFRDEPLPQIKRAESAGIPQVLGAIEEIIHQAQSNQCFHLVVVTGVPGSGKTLVGLELVHRQRGGSGTADAIYLSNNDWLLHVLEHALGNAALLHSASWFLSTFLKDEQEIPRADIWVFDEAQRALDAARATSHAGRPMSDPEAFLRIGDRLAKGITLVVLIGEGQEIYYGEEEGIDAWDRAIAAVQCPVSVHCPPRLKDVFGHATHIETNRQFDLATSLRSHLAGDVHQWVNAFLDGEIREARRVAERVRTQGFDLYVTGSLAAAKKYVRTRYAGQRAKRYGIIVPQKASWEHSSGRWGIDNSLDAARNLRLDRWFNDPPESKYSCCQLYNAAVDFQVQGLELDFPIIVWGNDIYWRDGKWNLGNVNMNNTGDNRQLRINNYRVLLTRGRDGFVVVVPKAWKTYGLFLSAGLQELER